MASISFEGIHPLATTNALLNLTATLLLVTGYVLIKRRHVQAHKWVMLSAFATSMVFLVCYLAYHIWPVGAMATPFPGEGAIKVLYYVLLVSHIILAICVPPCTLVTIYFGLRDAREKHKKIARWTFPIWFYVSITGVIIYVMLYHLFSPVSTHAAMVSSGYKG